MVTLLSGERKLSPARHSVTGFDTCFMRGTVGAQKAPRVGRSVRRAGRRGYFAGSQPQTSAKDASPSAQAKRSVEQLWLSREAS